MNFFKKPITVLYLLFSVVLISIAFQNCSSPFEANSPDGNISDSFEVADGDESTVNEVKSLAIFEKTLYEDLQQNCAICHGTVQEPLFAVANSLDSHRLLFNKKYVDLESPENSFLAIKIRAGHNQLRESLADEIVASIETWSMDLQAAIAEDEVEPLPEEPVTEESETPPPPPPAQPPAQEPPPVTNEPPAAEPVEHTFSYVHANILVPQCVSCHSPRSAGGLGLVDNYSTYATTMAGDSVKAGNASGSSLFIEVSKGKMPPGGQLNDDELSYIKAWIDAGAKNN